MSVIFFADLRKDWARQKKTIDQLVRGGGEEDRRVRGQPEALAHFVVDAFLVDAFLVAGESRGLSLYRLQRDTKSLEIIVAPWATHRHVSLFREWS